MPDTNCLIVADGSIATLVAVWREAICQSGSETLKPALWVPGGMLDIATVANANIAQAAGVETILQGEAPRAESGISATTMLLAAAQAAISRSIPRIVWPVQFGTTDAATRLTQVGGAFDRALLAARLISIDARQSTGQSLLIHTPFADLTDAQLVDLGADMDAPLGTAWWCEVQTQPGQTPCGKCAACLRWLGAMKRAGVVPAVARLASSLLEDKPAATTIPA